MSQHNIIGSEAFDGRPYIIVRQVRSGIGRRRRRPALVLTIVAVVALLAGAAAAVFALAPMLVEFNPPATTTKATDMRDQMRLQRVEPAANDMQASSAATTASAPSA